MEKVSIIILNYNGWADTIECLESLNSMVCPSNLDVRIIVVDNGSTNESKEKVVDWMSQCGHEYCQLGEGDTSGYKMEKMVLLRSKDNYGFSGGNNLGIIFARDIIQSDYYLLLNNDTVVEKDFLRPLIEQIEKDDKIGIVGAEIHDYYHPEQFTLGGKLNYLKCSGYHCYDKRVLNKKNITFTSGCIWLLRKKAVEKCGLLDASYFLYVEDVEYCHRMVSHGYTITCTEDSKIYHKESRSTKYKPIIHYYNTRNRLYLASTIKGHSVELIAFKPYFFITRIITMLKKPETRKYIIEGYKDYKKGVRGKYNE